MKGTLTEMAGNGTEREAVKVEDIREVNTYLFILLHLVHNRHSSLVIIIFLYLLHIECKYIVILQ